MGETESVGLEEEDILEAFELDDCMMEGILTGGTACHLPQLSRTWSS